MRASASLPMTSLVLGSSLLLSACQPSGEDDSPGPDHVITGYQADMWFEPEALQANAAAEVYYSVLDQDGYVVQDLQQSHERFIHTFFISQDLSYFRHSHHEDFYDADFEYLENGGWHQPITFPLSGAYQSVLDFAHQNLEHTLTAEWQVGGDIPQLEAPEEDLSTTVSSGGVVGTLVWSVPPVAGFRAEWTLSLKTEAGAPVTDVVQWLGADAHVAIVRSDLSSFLHTHAYVEGMEDMPPTHTMPHEYDGPELPFKVAISDPGLHKMWIQFARATAPDEPITLPFMFRVAQD